VHVSQVGVGCARSMAHGITACMYKYCGIGFYGSGVQFFHTHTLHNPLCYLPQTLLRLLHCLCWAWMACNALLTGVTCPVSLAAQL
jgi:hypothetical protein